MRTQMRVFARKTETGYYQGTVVMPSLATTRLVKEDKSYNYSTIANLRQAALAAAKRYNCGLVFVDSSAKKVAAKKSSK